MEKKFWFPTITSQFKVCSIPYHLDMYRGCVFNCQYCFARDFTTFARRNKKTEDEKKFEYLIGNRADLFRNWIQRVESKEYDYTKPHEVAFKERIPIKIGATADPFPPIESKEHVTYEFLKVLHEIDYPVEIQTKNPKILAEYIKDFKNPNWTVAVTLISHDSNFVKQLEPNTLSPTKRLKYVKQITDQDVPVMIKIQPVIFPKIMDDMEELLKHAKESGVWAFNTEGLKLRVSMPKHEQKIIQESIGDYLGIDIRDYYKKNGSINGSDYELNDKKQYIDLAEELALKYNLTYFSSDNDMKGGCNSECCGTQKLKNYKIWGNNLRTKSFDKIDTTNINSNELGKCLVNFSRSTKYSNLTLDEVMEIEYKKQDENKNVENNLW